MLPIVPRRFVTTRNLDMEDVSANLRALAADIKRASSRRYTYSTLIFPFAGMADTDAQVLRELFLDKSTTGSLPNATIVGIEWYMHGATAVTATMTCVEDDTWEPIVIETSATVATEVSGVSNQPISWAGNNGVTLRMSFSGAYTADAGWIAVHLRFDRGNPTEYAPIGLTSATSTAGAILDAELVDAAAAVAADAANSRDVRMECFTLRGLGAAGSRVFRLPGGVRSPQQLVLQIVGPVNSTASFEMTGPANGPTTQAGTGATTRAQTIATAYTGSATNDPDDSTDDTVVTISNTGAATADLITAFLFWV